MKLLLVLLVGVVAVAHSIPTQTGGAETEDRAASGKTRWQEAERVCNIARCGHISLECEKCARPCMMQPPHKEGGDAYMQCMYGDVSALCARARSCVVACDNAAELVRELP